MAKPRFLGKRRGRALLLGENRWLSPVSLLKQVAEPRFSKKVVADIATWGKQVGNTHFSETTGGRALLAENRFLGENWAQSLISRG